MKISIVTASFNQGSFILDAIESVLAQNYTNVEHIILDNCSSDETPRVLARYSHLKIIREKDRGQSDALNRGFKMATGDIVGWLNADDRYLPGCFDAVLKGFVDMPSCDLLYGDYRFINVKGNLIRTRRELSFDMFMLKYLHILYIPTTTSFFKRKIFDEQNFLDINYHYAMDYEFFLRLASKGYKFGHLPKLMADFRWHEQSKSFLDIESPKEEMNKALLLHDPFIVTVPTPLRCVVRSLLMIMARAKRFVLKLLKGNYCVQ